MSFWLRVQWILPCKLFNLHSLLHWCCYCTFPIGWPQKVLCVSSNFENDRLRGKSEPYNLFLLRLGKVRKSQTVLAICFKIFQFTCNLLPPFPLLCLISSSVSQYNMVKMFEWLWAANQSDLYVKNWRNYHMVPVYHQLCWVWIQVLTEKKWEKPRFSHVSVYRTQLWFLLNFPSF